MVAVLNKASADEQRAEREGFAARRAGKQESANPYSGNMAQWWRRGWWKADEEEHPIYRSLQSTRERHKALGNWANRIRGKAANSENAGETGGFLVPEELRVGIDQAIAEESFFHQHAWVQPMASKTLRVPSCDPGAAVSGGSPLLGGFRMFWLAGDSVAPTESEATFEQLLVTAMDLGGYSLLSNQLVDDGGEVLGAYIEAIVAKAVAFYTEKACFQGSGLAEFQGIINSPGTAVVARNTTSSIVAADVANMLKQLLPASYPHAYWCCSPGAFGLVSAFPGFFPALTDEPGIMGSLRGIPVFVTEAVPNLGTLGDLCLFDPRLFILGVRGDLELAWTKEFPAAYLRNQSVLRAWYRAGGGTAWRTTGTSASGLAGISPYVVLNT